MSDETTTPQPDLPDKPKVVISSTSFDLPEHRKQVIEACHRMSCDPLPMEYLTAADATAVEESLRLVNEADIYIGIFAHRYGFVPPGQDGPKRSHISITEMEYNRAEERGIPRLIFFMHADHSVKAKDVETGPPANKLKTLKKRIGEARVAAFFTGEKDLRAHVVEALSQAKTLKATKTAADFHYVRPIPPLDEPYVAHPYTLLAEAHGLVGRQAELTALTHWVARPDSRAYVGRLFFLVAIGGMGKSALTWHWFQNIAQQEMPGLQGRLWWSFYESDATFENFIIRALAYTTGQSIEAVRKTAPAEREAWLLDCLDRSPHLIVLDGLERILLAYNRHDAARLADDDLDDHTANRVAEAYGLPETAGQSFVGRHRLRMTTDPRAGQFLRRLTHVRASRILVSTRLYPSNLQRPDGFPVGNCYAHFLNGLSDNDAVDLWRTFGARGQRDELLRLFATVERHPLLIQTLASQVSRNRAANGDFDKWRAAHPDFNPFQLVGQSERKSHILRHAMTGLTAEESRLLSTVAAFRMPSNYETLSALFGDGVTRGQGEGVKDDADTPLPSHRVTLSLPHLDATLADLEDRGLLGWDRRANRYDLHPIVRGVVLSGLTESSRTDIYTTLHAHFEPIDTPAWQQVESLDDLTPAIELFNTLIELERYDDAFTVFRDRLEAATLYRLSASHLRVELAERLFPDGVDQPPRLSRASAQGFVLNVLALGYQFSGQPGAAEPVLRRLREFDEQEVDQQSLSVTLCNLSDAQRLSGDVRGAEASARTALQIGRETNNEFQQGVSLQFLGLALAVRTNTSEPSASDADKHVGPVPTGRSDSRPVGTGPTTRSNLHEADAALSRSIQLWQQQNHQQCDGLVNAFLAEAALWRGDSESARSLADRAWELASVNRAEADFIRAARLQGTAALRRLTLRVEPPETAQPVGTARNSDGLSTNTQRGAPSHEFAHERLHHALTRARGCQLVEEELPTLIALAELHWRLAGEPSRRLEQAQRSSGNGSPESTLKTNPAGTALHLSQPTAEGDNIAGSPIGLPEAAVMQTSLNAAPAEHLAQARELLDDVWDRAEAGPYPLFHADALNMLAAIERLQADESSLQTPGVDHRAAAIAAAQEAYEKAWLQGPPFAYAFGLANAQAHLDALGADYPDMPPYDDSLYEPMPEVDIDPKD